MAGNSIKQLQEQKRTEKVEKEKLGLEIKKHEAEIEEKSKHHGKR